MSIFSALIAPVSEIIREVVPDGDKRFALEREIERLLIEQEAKFVEAGRGRSQWRELVTTQLAPGFHVGICGCNCK